MNYYLILSLVVLVYMSSWFVLSLFKKRNDVADTAWGLGFVLVAWLSAYLIVGIDWRSLIVCSLVSLWGLRLAWHIHKRNKNKAEDSRYKVWREQWGKWFYIRSYFQVYILQGALLFLVSLPILIINKNTGSALGIFDLAGILIWILGFSFEVVGDRQLANFTKNPENKGKLLQSGLWAYTRHPNYFGEVTLWWGIFLMALAVPNGYIAIMGPLTITFLILKVSGIPLLEKKMSTNPDFEDYKRKTSIFIPKKILKIPLISIGVMVLASSFFLNESKPWGEVVVGDLDKDGDMDKAIWLVEDSQGSGVFYWAQLLINKNGRYEPTKKMFLGDRIAPQNINIIDGRAVYNFADRRADEPMVAIPSVGKSVWVHYDPATNSIGEWVKDFEGETN